MMMIPSQELVNIVSQDKTVFLQYDFIPLKYCLSCHCEILDQVFNSQKDAMIYYCLSLGRNFLELVKYYETSMYISIWFYGISIIVGYLMTNLFLYIWTVLFQTIQFIMSTQFSSIWPWVDMGATTIKGYSASPKAPALLELTIRLLIVIIGH